jgi:hypothetical protein
MLNTRDPQRGSAILITLILIAAMLAGIAVLVSLQLASTKSTELTRDGMSALHCAEAGLAATHNLVGTQRSAVTTHLTTTQTVAAYNDTVEPAFITTSLPNNLRDVDGDGVFPDFQIYLIDNDDGSDYTADSDSRVFLISVCTKYPDNPKRVMELIEFPANPTMYDWQEGRGFGNNNGNAY